MNKHNIVLLTIVTCTIVSGCGKSKEKLAAEANANRLQIEAVAAAASASEARLADLERKRADETLVQKFQTTTAQYLKDPSSAQFQNVKLNTARTALCGKFNSKNSYGGYVGFREFIATDTELFMKPEGCGVLSLVQMLEKSPTDGASCMKYVLALERDKLCQ